MNHPMQGKICLITGGSDGIGYAASRELARMGARVVIVGRNSAKTQAAVREIIADTDNPAVECLLADLSSQSEVRRVAAEAMELVPHLHVLLNNAGAIFLSDRRIAECQCIGTIVQRIEEQFYISTQSTPRLCRRLLRQARMEIYARVRRACLAEGMSVREASRVFGVHRNTVRKMWTYAVPLVYRPENPPWSPKLEPYTGVVGAIVEADARVQETASHGQAHLRAAQERVRVRWSAHHRQGLCQGAPAVDAGGARDVVPRSCPLPVRFRRDGSA